MEQAALKKLCSVCSKPLSLKHINFTTALYICTDLTCPYPVGHQCIVVESNLEDAKKKKPHRKKSSKQVQKLNSSDLDSFVNEVFNSTVSERVAEDKSDFSEDISKMFSSQEGLAQTANSVEQEINFDELFG